MNKIYLLFFFSCYTAAVAAQNKSITDIPLKPHGREVDIFFNEEKPKEPFYKVKIVEVQSAPGTSMDDQLIRLKKTAQQEGIDGILVGDIGKQAANIVSYPDAGGITSYQKLLGIGIRYRRTVDYVDTILKSQSVRFWNDSNPAPKQFTMRYDFYGKNLSLADPFVHDFFDDEIYPFADAGTYSPPFEGWQCRYDPEEQLFLKKKLKDGLTYIICHFYYMEGRLIKADVKHNALAGIQKKLEYRLEPDYNAAGLLTGRRLFHNKDLVWVDNITYRLNGMPDKIQRFKFTNGLQTALFEIKNEYYSDTDLPAPEH